MDHYENPAVVIGGGVNGLGVIRNLGRAGIDVYCVVNEQDEAIYSKWCKEYFVFPGVTHDLPKLRIFLAKFPDYVARRPVLFPTSDISILNIASLIEEKGNYLTSISDKEILKTLVNKRKFYSSLMTKKTPHPVTIFPDTADNLETISERIPFPVFVKPSISPIFFRRFRKKGFVANTLTELSRYLQLADRYKIDVMVQEIIPGPATNHYFIDGYFDKYSKPVILFARRRLRMWPLTFGNSTACVSVSMSEVADLKETIVQYLSSIRFHGIFSTEFKIDPRDNVGKILEVNARSWWYNSFPSACGANIIFAAYLEAIGKDVPPIKDYEIDKRLIYFTQDVRWLLTMVAQRKPFLREWLSTMIGKKDWVVYASDDPAPFIMNIVGATAAIANQEVLARLMKA